MQSAAARRSACPASTALRERRSPHATGCAPRATRLRVSPRAIHPALIALPRDLHEKKTVSVYVNQRATSAGSRRGCISLLRGEEGALLDWLMEFL